MRPDKHPFEGLRLLVVEDEPELMEEANEFFRTLTLPFRLSVRYASTVAEALPLVDEADAALCAALFDADSPAISTLPLGMDVARRCFERGLPAAFLGCERDKARRGSLKYLSDWARLRGTCLFERNVLKDPPPEKPWKEALCGVLYIKLGILKKAFAVDPERGFVNGVPTPPLIGPVSPDEVSSYSAFLHEWRPALHNLRGLRLWALEFCNEDPYYDPYWWESRARFDPLSREFEMLLPRN